MRASRRAATQQRFVLISNLIFFLSILSSVYVAYSIHSDKALALSIIEKRAVNREKKIHDRKNFLSKSKRALQSKDVQFFKDEISAVDPKAFREVIAQYLGLVPITEGFPAVKVSGHHAFEAGSQAVDMEVETQYIPENKEEILKAEIQLVGRNKKSKSCRVSGTGHGGRRLVLQYGEDCIGISADASIMVVCDGVGSSTGAHLASNAAVELTLACMESGGNILEKATSILDYILNFYKMAALTGSTTWTVGQWDGKKLTIAHVGDSYCSVVDPEAQEMVFMTMPREYKPNQPLQLYANLRLEDNFITGYEVDVEPGSIIMLYSDSIGDNMWPAQISAFDNAVDIAAKTVALFTEHLTSDIPFNKKMQSNFKGKEDDTSIIMRFL